MIEINLTQEELDAFIEMGVVSIENYLKSIASSHIAQKVDSQLMAKSLVEKQALLVE
jgi:hypothetical protein